MALILNFIKPGRLLRRLKAKGQLRPLTYNGPVSYPAETLKRYCSHHWSRKPNFVFHSVIAQIFYLSNHIWMFLSLFFSFPQRSRSIRPHVGQRKRQKLCKFQFFGPCSLESLNSSLIYEVSKFTSNPGSFITSWDCITRLVSCRRKELYSKLYCLIEICPWRVKNVPFSLLIFLYLNNMYRFALREYL